MEMTTSDHSEPQVVPSTGDDHQEEITPPLNATEGVMDCKQGTGEEEAKKIFELIAATGKFWLEWEKLKSLLSSQLKQVLSEYPEVKMSIEDQKSLLGGETYEELVNRLDEALCSFVEGPPFTLQRLCEIILDAKDIYPKLSKLALALEKNLLVTSTLTISTDPYPSPITKKTEEVEKIVEPQPESDSILGDKHVTIDKDEVMMEVEAADCKERENDDMKVDEASEEKSESTAPEPMPTTDVKPVNSQSA